MVKKIEVDGLKLLTELEWHAIPDGQSIQKYVKDVNILDKKAFNIKRFIKDISSNELIGLFNDEKVNKMPLALGVFTAANRFRNKEFYKTNDIGLSESWIVLLKIDDDKYWSCIIKDGMPVLNEYCDKVASLSYFYNEIENVLNKYAGDEKFVIVSNVDNDKYSDFIDLGADFELVDVLDLYKKTKSSAKIITLRKGKLPLFVFICLCVCGYFGYNYYQDYQEEQENKRILLIQAQENERKINQIKKYKAEYEIEKKNAIEKALNDAKNELNEELSNSKAVSLLNSWMKIINSVRLDQAGWNFDKIDCSVHENKPICVISLKRGFFGTNKMLLNLLKNRDVEIIGDEATYTITSDSNIEKTKVNYQTLNDISYFNKVIVSNFQIIKMGDIEYSIDSPVEILKNINLPSPPIGVNQVMEINQIRTGVSKGNYVLNGNDFSLISGLKKYLDDSSLSVNNLSIQFADSNGLTASWILNGGYYTKINDNMVLPYISESEIVLVDSL